ncbi:MAG: hypothetical protein LUC43_05355 [Burkholderiales bacterium]|nr:hypothetical protein [Burkholderiales bacterium]
MTNSEKRVLIREYSRLLNKIDKPVGLLEGLLLLPHLREDVKVMLKKAGYEEPEADKAILRDNPKDAFNETYEHLDEIVQWFVEHPTLKLEEEGKRLDPVKALNKAIAMMIETEDSFIESYFKGDFPDGATTLLKTETVLHNIGNCLLSKINKMIRSLPTEDEREIASIEFFAFSECEAPANSLSVFAPQSFAVN